MRNLSPPFAIRISSDEGDMYVRNGPVPGEGPLATFTTMAAALLVVDQFRPGLEPGQHPAVVPLAAVPANER